MSDIVDKLTREQKELLLEKLRMKEAKQKETVLDRLVPATEAQDQFFKSQACVRAYMGGNGVGKTTALIIELIWAHTQTHPYRDCSDVHHTWVLVPNYAKVEDYVADLRKFCPPSQFPKIDKLGTPNIRRLIWTNGSRTTFVSHDTPFMAAEGTNISVLMADESPPRSLWVAAYRGLRDNPNYYVILALTPISEPWIYHEIFIPWTRGEAEDTEIFTATTWDNKYLTREYIEDFASRLSEAEYRVRILGEFASLQGRVFQEFTRATHVIDKQEWPKNWPVYVSIDPHLRKPHTAVFVGVTPDDDLCVVDELAVDGTIDELADALIKLEKEKQYHVVHRIIDNSGSGTDWSRDTAVDIINRRYRAAEMGGVSPVPKEVKSVETGLARLRSYLRGEPDRDGNLIPRLKVMEHCVNVITEFETYSYQKARNEEKTGLSERPMKVFDDFIDPLRYITMSNPRHNVSLDIIRTVDTSHTYNKPHKPKPMSKTQLRTYIDRLRMKSKDNKKDYV